MEMPPMSMLNIKPETYERLARKAAERNTTVEKLVEPVLEQLAGTETSALNTAQRVAAWEAWVSEMRAWGAANLPAGHLVDDSRETIYDGRGE